MEQLLKLLEKNYPVSRNDTTLEKYMTEIYDYIKKNKAKSLLFFVALITFAKWGKLAYSFTYQLTGVDILALVYALTCDPKTRSLILLFGKLEGYKISYKSEELFRISELTKNEDQYLNAKRILEDFIEQKNNQPPEKRVLFVYTSYLLKILFRHKKTSDIGIEKLKTINNLILENCPYSELQKIDIHLPDINPGSVEHNYHMGYYPQNKKTIFMINLICFLASPLFGKYSDIENLYEEVTSKKIRHHDMSDFYINTSYALIKTYAFPNIDKYFSYLESFPEVSAKEEYFRISGIREKFEIFEFYEKKLPKAILKIIFEYNEDPLDIMDNSIFNNEKFPEYAKSATENLLTFMATYNPKKNPIPEKSAEFLKLLEQNGYTKEIYDANRDICLKNLENRVCRELKVFELPPYFMSVYSYKTNKHIHLRDLVEKKFTPEIEHLVYVLLIRYETVRKNYRVTDFANDYKFYDNSGNLRGHDDIPIPEAPQQTGAGFQNIYIIMFIVVIIILILVLLVSGLWSQYNRNPDRTFR